MRRWIVLWAVVGLGAGMTPLSAAIDQPGRPGPFTHTPAPNVRMALLIRRGAIRWKARALGRRQADQEPTEPVLMLAEDLSSLQTLAKMKLTPDQIKITAPYLAHLSNLPPASNEQASTVRLVALLEKERDLLASHQAVPLKLLLDIGQEQSLQEVWQSQQQQDIENAAQRLFFTLSDPQADALSPYDQTPRHERLARQTLLNAVNRSPAKYVALQARLKARYPDTADKMIALIDKARALKPADFTQQVAALATQLAAITPIITHGLEPGADDSATATYLVNLLQRTVVQSAIFRAAKLPGTVSKAATSDAGTAGAPDLDRQQDILEQQIRALRMIQAFGFTPDEIDAGLSWFQKADDARDQFSASSDTAKSLQKLIQKTSDGFVTGKAATDDELQTAAAAVEQVGVRQQDIEANLELAVMSMINDMPKSQLARLLDTTTVPYTRIVYMLDTVRNLTLPQYVVNEAVYAHEIAGQDAADATLKKVEAIFRGARMLSTAEMDARTGQLVREIGEAIKPPAPPPAVKPAVAVPPPAPAAVKPAAAPAADTTAIPAAEEQQELIVNQTAKTIAPMLNAPGLSVIIYKGMRHR